MHIDKTFGEKQPNVNYHDRQGVYLIAENNGKIAVVKTEKGYFLVGGGIENGENHKQCLERECLEETGFIIKIKDFLFSAEQYCTHEKLGYFHPIQFYYSGEFIEKIREPIETDHILEWIPIKDFDLKMYAITQDFAVKKYISKHI